MAKARTAKKSVHKKGVKRAFRKTARRSRQTGAGAYDTVFEDFLTNKVTDGDDKFWREKITFIPLIYNFAQYENIIKEIHNIPDEDIIEKNKLYGKEGKVIDYFNVNKKYSKTLQKMLDYGDIKLFNKFNIINKEFSDKSKKDLRALYYMLSENDLKSDVKKIFVKFDEENIKTKEIVDNYKTAVLRLFSILVLKIKEDEKNKLKYEKLSLELYRLRDETSSLSTLKKQTYNIMAMVFSLAVDYSKYIEGENNTKYSNGTDVNGDTAIPQKNILHFAEGSTNNQRNSTSFVYTYNPFHEQKAILKGSVNRGPPKPPRPPLSNYTSKYTNTISLAPNGNKETGNHPIGSLFAVNEKGKL